MNEVEIKLQLPPDSAAGVEREFGAAARRTRLRAIYFDTPDGALAGAGLALRLRQEGRRWMQTLKAGPAHGLVRAEHNVARARPKAGEPLPDPALHAGTLAGDALVRLLAGAGPGALLARYRTDVWRRHRELRARSGRVELALDRGEISATGGDGVLRRWPVCELEIELLSGAPGTVTTVARRFAQRHALWPDTRTKAERGDRLARGIAATDPVPAVKAEEMSLAPELTPAAAWRAVLGNVLAQALPNWSEVAAGSGAAESVHQLRVALRRLRSAQRLFDGWPGVPAPAWLPAANALFAALGRTRDRDVLAGGVQREIDAALAALGEPPLALALGAPTPDWNAAERAAHGALFIDLLDELLATSPASADAAEGAGGTDLKRLAAERLQRWHRQVRRDAKRFASLDDLARHRLRRRLKRLRYAVEFCTGLFARRGQARYLERLRVAQEQLGAYNDLWMALQIYRPIVAGEPRAWFALGWLEARRAAALAECAADLQKLRKLDPFWR